MGQIRLPPEFHLPRQTPSGRKVRGRKERRKKKKKERIMPSLVATTSALTRKPCVRTHYVCTNYCWCFQPTMLPPTTTLPGNVNG